MSAEAIVFFDPELADARPLSPQARGAPAIEGPVPRRAAPGDARGRPVAGQCPRRQRRRCRDRRRVRRAPDAPGRGQRAVRPPDPRRARQRCAAQGFGFYDWGADAARFVTAWNTRDERCPGAGAAPSPPCERRTPTAARAAAAARSRCRSSLVALIWGSTWFVITGQIGAGAAELVGRLSLRARHAGDVRAGAGRRGNRCACRGGPLAGAGARAVPVLRQLQLRLSGRTAPDLRASWR